MKIAFKYVMLAIAVLSSVSIARAEIIDQIPSPFAAYTIGMVGSPLQPSYSAQSMTDNSVGGSGAFSEAFDNFKLLTDTTITQIDWIGRYDGSSTVKDAFGDYLADPGTVPIAFKINFYADSAGDVGTLTNTVSLVASVSPAGQTAVTPTGGQPLFYSYSTSIPSISVTAGTQFWVSVVGEMDYGDNGWGLAASDVGAVLSSAQNFQGTPYRGDPWNYAMRITAVPEPSAGIAWLALAGIMGFRRRK